MRIVVPFTPAGAVDIATRATAHEMTKILGQTGGGREQARRRRQPRRARRGALGARRLLDGDEHQRHPGDQPGALRQDAARSEQGARSRSRRSSSLTNVLVVHPSVPARSVKEVIALAKKDPGKWTYASSGNGTSIHMSGAMFTQFTGTDILHIPYKGSAPGGHRPARRADQHDVRQHPVVAAAHQVGQADRARHHRREARPGAARPADDRRGRRAGLRVGRVVRPRWCRPARRATSS